MLGRKPLCNKNANSAPHFKGFVFFLCWRCSGVVVGSLLTLPFFEALYYAVSPPALTLLALPLMLPLIVDGIRQYFFHKPSNNPRRFITGLLFGWALQTLFYLFIAVCLLSLYQSPLFKG